MKTVNLIISGMTCDHCAITIEAALAKIVGVDKASVSYGDKIAQITLKPDTDLNADTLIKSVQSAGYDAALNIPESKSSELVNTPLTAPPETGVKHEMPLNIVIIGSGSAAFASALEAKDLGAQVTMIEAGTVGGTCVNVGCVPSKIMIRAAQMAHQQAHHPFSGIETHVPSIDRTKLVIQQQARVDALRHDKYESILESNPEINLIKGRARFQDANTIIVTKDDGSTQTITGNRFLIATGRTPVLPPITGLADTPYWTSTTALIATEIPQHLIVLGASVVAVEIAQAFLRLGAKVTMLARSTFLSQEDPDIANGLQQALVAEGMIIMTGANVSHVKHEENLFKVNVNDQIINGNQLFVAAGRTPNTKDLCLENIQVNTTEKGEIIVDAHMRSSVSNIFAAGDCTPLPQYVYVAASSGKKAARNMVGQEATLDLLAMPAVIFSDPQIATVGLTEQQAIAQGLKVECRKLGLENVPRALANFDTTGLIKIVAEKETGRIVGVQILAAEASEMIQTAVLAIRHRMTVQSLTQELFPYLTMVEGLKLCALTFFKDVKQLSCCAG